MKPADFVTTIFDNAETNPAKVTVGFTMAVNALKQGHSAVVLLMVDAVHLGKPGAMDGIAIGAPFAPMKELLKNYLDLGGRIALCKACMVHNGLKDEEMVPEYEIINAPDVVEALMSAKGALQLS